MLSVWATTDASKTGPLSWKHETDIQKLSEIAVHNKWLWFKKESRKETSTCSQEQLHTLLFFLSIVFLSFKKLVAVTHSLIATAFALLEHLQSSIGHWYMSDISILNVLPFQSSKCSYIFWMFLISPNRKLVNFLYH